MQLHFFESEVIGQDLYLVIDQQFHGIVAPLDEHQFICLARDGVGEGGADARPVATLQPQAHRQSEDLVQERPLDAGIHVVGSHREANLEGVRVLGLGLTSCRNK